MHIIKRYFNNKMKSNLFLLNYSRMWPFVKPFWFRALLSVIITIPIGALDAVVALSLKPFMDTVIMEKGGETPFNLPIFVIPAFIIFFTFIQSGLNYASAYLSTWVGGKITNGVKYKIYQKLINCDSSFADNTSSGNIVFRCDTDPNLACSGLLTNLKTFTTRIFSSISLLCVLFYTSWQLALIAIVVLGSALYPLKNIRKRIKDIMKSSVVAGGAVLTSFNETYAGIKTIASYNLQKQQSKKFQAILNQLFRLQIKHTQRTGWLSPMMHMVISIGIAGTIWYGSYLIKSNTMTGGDFVSFMTALLMLYTPIKNIGKNFTSVQLSFMAIERVFDFLEQDMSVKNHKNAQHLTTFKNAIEYKDLSFSYNKKKMVLDNINLTINRGQTIAFVGNSGGGKTTIVNLLPRFYEITKGSILIDGVDIREYNLHDLRDKIAVVFQDNFLFSGTIKENILIGKETATKQEIDSAIESACLSEFIQSLPKGLDTEIGERGVLLSGGQKQRISIARAFIKNAPIVILDEATSALDNKSEAIVQQAIDNLMSDRTVLVIAHRLSTIQNADKIVVINEGKIIETGTHTELLAKQKAYNALYMAQFK